MHTLLLSVFLCMAAFAGVVHAEPLRPAPEPVDLDQAPLEDALKYASRRAGVPIVVDWNRLELAGANKATPITLELPASTPLRQLLTLTLQASGTREPLEFYADSGLIRITTRRHADTDLVTRVYDVRDLTVEIPDFSLDDIGGGQNGGNGQNSGGTANSGGNRGNTGGGSSGGFSGDGQSRQDREQAIVELIRATVRPDIWRDNGGPASIRSFQGQLVITAPRSVHAQIR